MTKEKSKISKKAWSIICAVAVVLGLLGYFGIQPYWTKSSSPPHKVSTIDGNNNIQVIGSSEVTIITNETDPKERAKQNTILQNTEENKRTLIRIQESLNAKNIEADPQLVSKLKDKIQELEKELEMLTRTTKDKRAEEALVASKAGHYEKARELFESLRKEEKEKEREHARTAYNLGNVYFVELDFPKALEAYLDAVRLAPDNSTYLNDAGMSFHALAQYDKAIEYYEKALSVFRVRLGNDHPHTKVVETHLRLARKGKLELNEGPGQK